MELKFRHTYVIISMISGLLNVVLEGFGSPFIYSGSSFEVVGSIEDDNHIIAFRAFELSNDAFAGFVGETGFCTCYGKIGEEQSIVRSKIVFPFLLVPSDHSVTFF